MLKGIPEFPNAFINNIELWVPVKNEISMCVRKDLALPK